MGTGKKEATRKENQGKTGDGMNNVKTKGENFYRSVCCHIISIRSVSIMLYSANISCCSILAIETLC